MAYWTLQVISSVQFYIMYSSRQMEKKYVDLQEQVGSNLMRNMSVDRTCILIHRGTLMAKWLGRVCQDMKSGCADMI